MNTCSKSLDMNIPIKSADFILIFCIYFVEKICVIQYNGFQQPIQLAKIGKN